MDFTLMVVVAGIVAAITYWLYLYWSYRNFPPGPYGLPLVGYAPFVGDNAHLKFKNLSKKYGGVFSITLGMSNPAVVLNDLQSIKEVLIKQGEVFSGRPNILTLNTLFRRKDVTWTDGPVWKENRAFAIRVLKDFGMGRSVMEAVVIEEVEKLTTFLRTQEGRPVNIDLLFFTPVMNIIWGLVSGKVFDPTAPSTIQFSKAFHYLASNSTVNVINLWPFLRHIAPGLIGFTGFRAAAANIHDYLGELVDTHWKDFRQNPNRMSDLIDIYVAEIERRRAEKKPDEPPYNRDHLIGTIQDCFLGGVETLDTTLTWSLLLVAHHPEVQRKVQEELDSVISADSYLSLNSRARTPYMEATLMEVQRYSSVVPFNMPHCTLEDATLAGYKIPKGTSILPNMWALHHDERYWGDPSNFRPERFLNEQGQLIKHEQYLPLSAGIRVCIGEALVKLELTLIFSSLLRRFTFELVTDEPKPSLEPIVGITLRSAPFSLMVKSR